MRIAKLIARTGLLSLWLLAGGCDITGGTLIVECFPLWFIALDHNGDPVRDVSVYLDFGTTPIAATSSSGDVGFPLNGGAHSVHFAKPGYAVRSYYNLRCGGPQWVVEMSPSPDTASTGILSGTIGNSQNGDRMIVQARRRSDGLSASATVDATGATAAYAVGAAPQGIVDLFVFPSDAGFDAGASYFTTAPSVPVSSVTPVTVDPILVRDNATSFSVAGANGFPGGTIQAGYAFGITGSYSWGISYPFNWIGSVSTAPLAGTTLSGVAVNIPPIRDRVGSAVYGLQVQAYDTANPTANYRTRTQTRAFDSFAHLSTANSSQSFVLSDDSVTPVTPVHGQINTGVAPTFSWSLSGNPQSVKLVVYEYEAGRGYIRRVWTAEVWYATSAPTTITPPPAVVLQPQTAYAYNLYARTQLSSSEFNRNGWEVVKFSTGASPSP